MIYFVRLIHAVCLHVCLFVFSLACFNTPSETGTPSHTPSFPPPLSPLSFIMFPSQLAGGENMVAVVAALRVLARVAERRGFEPGIHRIPAEDLKVSCRCDVDAAAVGS